MVDKTKFRRDNKMKKIMAIRKSKCREATRHIEEKEESRYADFIAGVVVGKELILALGYLARIQPQYTVKPRSRAKTFLFKALLSFI